MRRISSRRTSTSASKKDKRHFDYKSTTKKPSGTKFPVKGGPAPFKPVKGKPTKGRDKDTPKRPLRAGDKMDPRNKRTKGKGKKPVLFSEFGAGANRKKMEEMKKKRKKKAVTTSTKDPRRTNTTRGPVPAAKKGKDGTRITGATAGPRPKKPTAGKGKTNSGNPKTGAKKGPTYTIKGTGNKKVGNGAKPAPKTQTAQERFKAKSAASQKSAKDRVSSLNKSKAAYLKSKKPKFDK